MTKKNREKPLIFSVKYKSGFTISGSPSRSIVPSTTANHDPFSQARGRQAVSLQPHTEQTFASCQVQKVGEMKIGK